MGEIDPGTATVPKTKLRIAVGSLAGLVTVVFVVIALSQFGLWHVVNPPPRYQLPEGATGDVQRAVKVAQDAVREEQGRFVALDHTTVFKNQFGNYRVRGAVNNRFSVNKNVFVYEAIVDSESFECLEFRFD